ncbi:MAG: helix-turn-helix domain-containing protein [Halapricum sp.]
MSSEGKGGPTGSLDPDEAFAALGNETRMEILRALGDAGGTLSFSELYDRVDIRDSGQFTYHLDKLVGHFVRKNDDGYELHQSGIRVIEAVLSGAMTDTPVLDPTRIDFPCPYCGGPVEISYREERLLHRCRECPGEVGGGGLPEGTFELGYLPPAGLQDRTPEELVSASATWAVSERVATSNGVCPRCGGVVDHSLRVCEDHTSEGICDVCSRRRAVFVDSRCRNCPHEKGGVFPRLLLAEPRFRAFFDGRGIDLFALDFDHWDRFISYEEEVLGTDPFRARFIFTAEGATITLTVDESLAVVDVTESG